MEEIITDSIVEVEGGTDEGRKAEKEEVRKKDGREVV